MKCCESATTPIPHPPVLLCGEGGRRSMSEDEPGKKGGIGESVFSFVFVSHSPTLFLTGI